MICLLSGPDLLVKFYNFSRNQPFCRSAAEIQFLFWEICVLDIQPFLLLLCYLIVAIVPSLFVCMQSLWLYVVRVVFSQKSVQLFIQNSLFDLSGAHLYFQSQWNGLLIFVIYMIQMSWIWWFWCLWNKWKFDILFAVGDLEWADWWLVVSGIRWIIYLWAGFN